MKAVTGEIVSVAHIIQIQSSVHLVQVFSSSPWPHFGSCLSRGDGRGTIIQSCKQKDQMSKSP